MWNRFKGMMPDRIVVKVDPILLLLVVAVASGILLQAGLGWVLVVVGCLVALVACIGLLFGDFRGRLGNWDE
jgi:protein-S-isoprenylcysteine O-methyltransferase Ste14